MLDPSNDAIHLDLLTILRQLPESDAFPQAVARAIAHCPTSAALRFEAGLLASRAGELDTAAEHFSFAWQNRPDQTAAGFEGAAVYFRQGKSEKGVELLNDVLRLHPKESTAHLLLVQHGIETQDPRTSEWLQRAIRADPAAPRLAELRPNYQRRFGVTP
jgi:predicted Zn-dependent protease